MNVSDTITCQDNFASRITWTWTSFCLRFTNEMRKTSTCYHSLRKTRVKWRSRWRNATARIIFTTLLQSWCWIKQRC